MTRSITRYRTRTILSHSIKINGQDVNIDFARIVYRCAECLGRLRRKDAGLVCCNNEQHRGFIHRNEAATVAAERVAQMENVEAVYEIVDGQIVVKGI